MSTSGYSGTPLIKKLGIKENFRIKIVNQPSNYLELLGEIPPGVAFYAANNTKKNFIQLFSKTRNELESLVQGLIQELEQDGMLWISWPKKASKVPTDLNGNVVREIGLKHGLVDIKICAIDKVWSGLKFVIPLKSRK